MKTLPKPLYVCPLCGQERNGQIGKTLGAPRTDPKEFLKALLAEGAMSVPDILKEGRLFGIGKTALYRAGHALAVVSVIRGKGSSRSAYWNLPSRLETDKAV